MERVFGREPIDVEQGQAEMTDIARALEREYPEDNANRGVFLEPLHQAVVRDVRPALSVLMAAVAFVLLIACTNVANLLLMRAGTRDREMGVRMAIGAGGGRLIRQLLTESSILAGLGGIVGIVAARLLKDRGLTVAVLEAGRAGPWVQRPPRTTASGPRTRM